jgi:hypothetical protein
MRQIERGKSNEKYCKDTIGVNVLLALVDLPRQFIGWVIRILFVSNTRRSDKRKCIVWTYPNNEIASNFTKLWNNRGFPSSRSVPW